MNSEQVESLVALRAELTARWNALAEERCKLRRLLKALDDLLLTPEEPGAIPGDAASTLAASEPEKTPEGEP